MRTLDRENTMIHTPNKFFENTMILTPKGHKPTRSGLFVVTCSSVRKKRPEESKTVHDPPRNFPRRQTITTAISNSFSTYSPSGRVLRTRRLPTQVLYSQFRKPSPIWSPYISYILHLTSVGMKKQVMNHRDGTSAES